MSRPRPSRTILPVAAFLAAALPVHARGQVSEEAQPRDSAAVVATVEAFHTALQRADTAAVLELLTDDAVVVEGGSVESRDEYLGGHLGADMAFARAVSRETLLIRVRVAGDVAWMASTARRTGTFREREVDSRGAELVVLDHDGGRWRIRAVHWSSR